MRRGGQDGPLVPRLGRLAIPARRERHVLMSNGPALETEDFSFFTSGIFSTLGEFPYRRGPRTKQLKQRQLLCQAVSVPSFPPQSHMFPA